MKVLILLISNRIMNFERIKEILKNDKYFCASLNNLISISRSNNLNKSKAPLYLQRSVTQRIQEIKQPRGGYLPIKLFTEQKLNNDNLILEYKSKNDIKYFPSLLGLVVDYVSRYLYSKDLIKSFEISFLSIIKYLVDTNYTTNSFSEEECISLYNDFKKKLFSLESLNINDNNKSNIEIIKNIFIIVQLDSIYRAGYEPKELWQKTASNVRLIFNNHLEIPDYICNNALICIRRTLNFYNSKQNITFGECFGNGELISSGDCDFITNDTIWDMKVSSSNIYNNSSTIKWTLQILIYYLMLKHPSHNNFKKYTNVKNVGIFNPYLNVCYVLDVSKFVNNDYINEIKKEIIGIDWTPSYGYRLDNKKNLFLFNGLLMKDYPNIKIYSRNKDKE